ncbi:MAG TPA: DinB family protein [Acidimicrobiia bacterium]|nr:DinB family protein [Acidimicrobiia bacterium]
MGEAATPTMPGPIELFGVGLGESLGALSRVADRDWSAPAGTLDWSCWQTVDHVTDCLFSYSLQLAGRVRDGWLRLTELHAQPDATPSQLVEALGAVGRTFEAVLAAAPADAVASDTIFDLRPSDWAARALNELLLHTYDVLVGLGDEFEPSRAVCSFVLSTPTLWMYDGVERLDVPDPWRTMLVGSGRPTSRD